MTLTTKPPRARKCKATGCGTTFTPQRMGQRVCGPICALQIARQERELADRKATRARLTAMKTKPELVKEAQQAFNKFIRLRDRAQPCICCGKPLGAGEVGGSYDAGHYRSTGSAPHLRFDEANVHAQRKVCNRYGAGRAVDYRLGLIQRIGLPEVERLEADNTPRHLTRDDLIEIRDRYRALARQLEREVA